MPEPFEIAKEVALAATPAEVWEAIATTGGLAAWFMPMPMPMDADSDMVTAWEPGRRLAVQTPTAPDGSSQAFEYFIEGRDGSTTVLRFTHRGMLGDDWSDEFEPMTSSAWDMYLHTLAQYLLHFAGRPAQYVEADGPADSADAAAWPLLLEALGAPALGDTVHVFAADVGPVGGVVDYVSPTFLGVRTTDALVRFHGRWSIGMAVAVSHHHYGPPLDAEAATAGWQRWLRGVR